MSAEPARRRDEDGPEELDSPKALDSPAELDSPKALDSTEELDLLVGRYVDRLNGGEAIDRSRIESEHPEVAEELLRRLELFVRLGGDDRPEEPLAVLGDYRLLRQIGRGGMGLVYEAWQSSLDRRVALKVLPAGVACDNRSFLRFMREARTAGWLHHPNVVSVYGMGVEGGTPYYAMELVEGQTLARVLGSLGEAVEADPQAGRERWMALAVPLFAPCEDRQGGRETAAGEETAAAAGPAGPLALQPEYSRRAAAAFAGVADGLHHAHGKGIVHRDIKPSNLILDGAGRLRILDFGLARLEGEASLTRSGDLMGTPLYMSPEQARARRSPIDLRTDVYSVGATLYHVLAGRPVFQGADHHETLSRIVHAEPVSLRRIAPGIPRDLETIVLKCLRKEPAARYSTAEALAQDLRRFVRGDAIEARAQGGWEKLGRRLHRHRRGVLTGLTVLFLVLAAGLLLRFHLQDRRAAAEARYGREVVEAVMSLQLGEMTARAGAGHGEESPVDPQGVFRAGDLEVLAADEEPHPLARAVAVLEQAESVLPARPEAYYYRARGLYLLGRREEALDEVRRALERAPGFLPAHVLLAEIEGQEGLPAPEGWGRAWLEVRHALRQGEWQAGAELCGRLLRDTKGGEPFLGAAVELHLERGRALLEAGDVAQAMEGFIAARTLWPDARVPQLLLGKAYYQKGEKEDAERTFRALHAEAGAQGDEVALWVAALYKYFRDFERGLEWAARVGDESLRLRLRVDFLNLMGRWQEAIRLGTEAIERYPRDGLTHHFLAVALIRNPRTAARGLEVARRAHELEPRRADTLSLLACAHEMNGEREKARELFLEAIAMAPEEPRGHDHLGRLLIRAGDLAGAERRFREATRLVDRSGRYHFLNPHQALGACLAAQGRLEESVEWFSRSAKLYPGPYPLISRGTVLRKLGRLEEAQESLRAALELDPRGTQALRQMGLLALARGEADRAVTLLREAAAREPERSGAARRELALALVDLGRAGEALAAILELLRLGQMELMVHRALLDLGRISGGAPLGARWDEVVEALEASGADAPGKPTAPLVSLAAALARAGERRDPERARELTLRAVEETRRRSPDVLSLLAEIEDLRGRREEALLILEDAVNLPTARRIHALQLGALRRELHPLLPSFATAAALLESGALEAQAAPELRADALAALRFPEGPRGAAVRAFLEGRLLQRSGRLEEAETRLLRAATGGGGGPEAALALAECRRALGKPEEAERGLRAALEGRFAFRQDVWEMWAAVCLADLALAPSAVLESFPEARGRGEPSRDGPGGAGPGAVGRAPVGPEAEAHRAVSPAVAPVAVSPGVAGPATVSLEPVAQRGGPGADPAPGQALPGAAGAAGAARATGGEDSPGPRGDLRWLLQRLARGEPVRINCGGEDHRSASGEEWGRDRFFRGGGRKAPSTHDIAGTGEDALYRTARGFPEDALHRSYCLPLPRGSYRLRLHFAETGVGGPMPQRMDVTVEGQPALSGHAPVEAGYATADRRELEVEVEDGCLEIRLDSRRGEASITGLEVEPTGGKD